MQMIVGRTGARTGSRVDLFGEGRKFIRAAMPFSLADYGASTSRRMAAKKTNSLGLRQNGARSSIAKFFVRYDSVP